MHNVHKVTHSVFVSSIGKEVNKEHVAEQMTKLEGKLDGYEAMLSKHKYLAGDVRRPKML